MGCCLSYFFQHKPTLKVTKSKLENFNACLRERVVFVWLATAKWMHVKKEKILFKGGGDMLLFLL